MTFGLPENTINKINFVFVKYPEIEEVIIYGSRAKGEFREGSDIDITLKGETLNERILTNVTIDLDELNTPYLFDISLLNTLKSTSLVDHINRIGKTLYKKEN